MNTTPAQFLVLTPGAADALRISVSASAALVLAVALVMTYRWINGRSVVLGSLFAAGLIARAISGVALFAISLFGLPVFRGLQLGGGFWTLALDGRTYYEIAATAVAHGMSSISNSMPSPFYLRTLAVWMRVFGVSPASALLLNVASYTGIAILIVAVADLGGRVPSRRTDGAVIAFVAFTFSPALLIFGTQPVKDAFFIMLMVAVITGAQMWWAGLGELRSRSHGRMLAGAALLAIGIYGVSGIRAYVGFFTIAAFISASAYSIVFRAPRVRHLADVIVHAALIVLMWTAFIGGAGPYGATYEAQIFSMSRSPGTALVPFDSARDGFSATGGATSTDSAPVDASEGGTSSSEEPLPTLNSRLVRLVRGMAILTVPISLLSLTSVVHFSGGRGLLFVTDLDTLFVDVTFLASLWLLITATRRQRLCPSAMFALVLGLAVAVSMAYVVTNYGTLFRLRLVAFAPLWMLSVMIPRGSQIDPGLPTSDQ